MYSAITKSGQVISLSHRRWDRDTLTRLKAEETFFCQGCHEQVMLKMGPHRKWHFAHYRQKACGSAEPESAYHLQGKDMLFDWLSAQDLSVEQEVYLREIKQRPDLFISSPYDVPVEYQCATIREELFIKRTEHYQKIKMQPLWILGGNRLKRLGKKTFQVSRMDWLTLNGMEASPSDVFLLYFCPKTDRFAHLTNLRPFSATRIVAHVRFLKREELHFATLFTQPIPDSSVELAGSLARIKRNWRLYPYQRNTPAHRYVNRIVQSNRKELTLFPAEAGLFTRHLHWIETPPYLWQTWLLTQWIHPLKKNEKVRFHEIYAQMKRLVEKGIFRVRTLPLLKNSHYSFAIMDYLLTLCDHRLLKRIGKSTFMKINDISFPKTLDEALEQDEKMYTEKMI